VPAVPIVRLIFEGDEFGADDTQRVALSLACFTARLLMFSMNEEC
jgi:peptidoglycan biosynthesis protein MviN/MurJ (putative lipid II flippase)